MRMVSCLDNSGEGAELKGVDTIISYGKQSSSTLIQDLDLGSVEPSSTIDQVLHLRSPIASMRVVDLSLEATLTDSITEDSPQHVEDINHTISLPISDPLTVSSSVIYRHKSSATESDGVEGWASVMSTLNVPGKRDLEIESITIEPRVSPLPRSSCRCGQKTDVAERCGRMYLELAITVWLSIPAK